MVIRQPMEVFRSVIAGILMLISAIGLFPIGMASREGVVLFFLMAGVLCLTVCMELRTRGASVEINGETRLVIFRRAGALLRKKVFAYALDDFSSVRSYATPGKGARNLIELITLSGGEALLISSHEPQWSSKGFFSVPVMMESADAMALRKAIAAECGLKDEGYLGVRWPGVYVSRKRRISIGADGDQGAA